jgi:hypothetical protein
MRSPSNRIQMDVESLLAHGSLRGVIPLYLTPTSAVVDGVVIASHLDDIQRVPPNSVVVLSPQIGSGGWLVSAALRYAWERRASAVIVAASEHSTSVIGLAERLRITLLATTDDPTSVALGLAGEIGAATSVIDAQLVRFARAVARESTLTGVLKTVSEEIDDSYITLEYAGVVLASAGAADRTRRASISVELRGLENTARAKLTAWRPDSQAHNPQVTLSTLEVAVPSVQAAWMLADAQETVNSVPTLALAGLGAVGAENLVAFEQRHRQLFTKLGWRPGQHYVAVWIRSTSEEPHRANITAVLRLLWRKVANRSSLAEVSGGWLAMIPSDYPEGAAQLDGHIRLRLGPALAELGLSAGLSGWQHAGVTLPAIVQEARLAAECAAVLGAGAVAAFGSLGIGAASAFINDAAIELLAELALPRLMAASDRDQIVDALVAYLDHQSSASAAAQSLNVHRNTLQSRLVRARELDVHMDDPSQLLATHLVLNVLKRSAATSKTSNSHTRDK